jgi:hypothetical protein
VVVVAYGNGIFGLIEYARFVTVFALFFFLFDFVGAAGLFLAIEWLGVWLGGLRRRVRSFGVVLWLGFVIGVGFGV